MKISAGENELRRWHEAGNDQTPPADLHVVTSDGQRIPAHSNVLASASSVLESLVYKPLKYWKSERVVQILGVPTDAVLAFLNLIYSSQRSALSSTEAKRAMELHGVQLLVLAHKYRMGWLKRGCELELARQLKPEFVVDVLQLARLCDASMLYQRCLSLVSKDFASVQQSDGWRFVQKNDPKLELEILHFLQEIDQRKRRWNRERGDQEMYQQLSEAMECLEHICTEGCTNVGPHDRALRSKNIGPCDKFQTCRGLQSLISHLSTCSKKLSSRGSCAHCKRMWQLFRLHSSLCDRSDSCKVPLCKQFKLKVQMEGKKGDDATWKLLVKKVAVARVMCSLARRRRPEQMHKLWARSYRIIK